jgi:hypothetical protein
MAERWRRGDAAGDVKMESAAADVQTVSNGAKKKGQNGKRGLEWICLL